MHVHIVDQNLRDARKKRGHIELIVVSRFEARVERVPQTRRLATHHQRADLYIRLVDVVRALLAANALDIGGELFVDG